MISREPLLAQLHARHRLAVVALESLPGFGRTVLLEQALAQGPLDPRDRDLLYRCIPGDASDARLARNILDLLSSQGAAVGEADVPFKSAEHGADAVAQALAIVARPDSHVALCIDDTERCGDEGAVLLAELVQRLPERCHLVLSGRRLPKFGLARLIAVETQFCSAEPISASTGRSCRNLVDPTWLACSVITNLLRGPLWPASCSRATTS